MPIYTSDDRIDPACQQAANRYLAACEALTDQSAWPLMMYCALNIFYWHLEAFEADEDPRPGFTNVFNSHAALLEAARPLSGHVFPAESLRADEVDFESRISGLFSDVWVGFTDEVYFDQSYEFTRERMKRNGVDAEKLFAGKTVVDAGCGSGKYSAAIARLGAAKVVGVDIGAKGLDFARQKAKQVPYGNRIEYVEASLLDIPLPNASVDMVWSNGVIHHTLDYERCLQEFARIVKPGGELYLYVEGPEGLFELMCDTFVAAHAKLPRALMQHYLSRLCVNTGRIYWIMDCLFAPYERKKPADVESLLRKYGFDDIRRLARGLDIDNNEMVAAGKPYAVIKHGDGMLKYLARKVA